MGPGGPVIVCALSLSKGQHPRTSSLVYAGDVHYRS
jgi:hypothetical protein